MKDWFIKIGPNQWWDKMQRPKYARKFLWKYGGWIVTGGRYLYKKIFNRKKKKESKLP
jgi:hypothetical protein